MVGRALQTSGLFFPPFSRSCPWQAYYCYCSLLFAVERAGRNHLHFTRFTENIGKFSIIP